MSEVTIRKATLEDYSAILSLHQEVSHMHFQGVGWNFESTTLSLEMELFESQIKNKNVHYLIAEIDNEVVGYIYFEKKNADSLEILKKREWIFIHEISIAQNHKNQGIGTLLLEEVEEYGIKNNIYSIELSVWSFNKEAIRFYKKLGFEEFSIKMRKNLLNAS